MTVGRADVVLPHRRSVVQGILLNDQVRARPWGAASQDSGTEAPPFRSPPSEGPDP